MRVVIAGGRGFVGSAVVQELIKSGFQVDLLTHSNQAGEFFFKWDPFKGELDLNFLEGADVIINLAGESVAGRWTNQKKRKIRDSRIFSTRTLVRGIEKLKTKPGLLINASAIGFYGYEQEGELTEEAKQGTGFLASVCKEWEDEAALVKNSGVRLVIPRLGMVVGKEGGALKNMLPIFQLGLGGRIGSGDQWISWIELRDAARLFVWLIHHREIEGVVNATSGHAITNREFTKALGTMLKRPAFIPLPAFAAHLLFDEMADELLLNGVNVVPKKLEKSGFVFDYPKIEDALQI